MDWGSGLSGAGGGALAGAQIGSVVPGIGTGIGALIGGGLGLFGGLKSGNAYDEARKQAMRGWMQSQGFQMPFLQHGMDQYGDLNTARQSLMNPEELQNKWAEGYETSPYAKRELEQNQQAGLEGASSMGLMGSSGALSNIQQGAGDIVQKDRQQYMNDLMQKYLSGIGLGQNLYGIGAQTGANLGQQANQQGVNMANIGYAQNMAPQNMMENYLKTALGMYGASQGWKGMPGANAS
jgi:hypothetical protein